MNLGKLFALILMWFGLTLMPSFTFAAVREPVPDFLRCKYWGDAPIDGAKAIEHYQHESIKKFSDECQPVGARNK